MSRSFRKINLYHPPIVHIVSMSRKWTTPRCSCNLVTGLCKLRFDYSINKKSRLGPLISFPVLTTRLQGKPSIAAYHNSVNYPDFFNDGLSNSKSNCTNSMKILEILEDANKRKDNRTGIQVFEEFHRNKPDWHKQWPAQKIAAFIFHMYLQAESFERLLALYKEIKADGFVHGEGIYITLIKCCVAANDLPKALAYLEELKSVGLRNIRIYAFLIRNLVEVGKLDTAFQLFKEMQKFELNQKSKKQLKDQDMLSSLLISASEKREECNGKSSEESRQLTESVNNVLDYIATRGITISNNLKSAILRIVDAFMKEYTVSIVSPGDRKSKETIDCIDGFVNGHDIETFAALLRSYKKSPQLALEEETLRDFVAKHGPFSVVIDGANVMLASRGSGHKLLTKMNEDNIIDVLECYKRSFALRKTLVIIPSTMERRSMFMQSKFYNKLKDIYHAEIFIAENISDDVAVLLAALYNDVCLLDDGLNADTKVITNDSLKEHISVTGEQQFKFQSWLNLKQIKFSWDWDDNAILHSFASSTMKDSNNWSFKLKSGQIMEIFKS